MDLKRQKIKILGVDVDDISPEVASEKILELAKEPNRGKYVVTVNPEFVMLAHRNREFGEILAKSDLSLADGVGVAISKLILGGKVPDRVTGTDMVEILCKKSAGKPIRIGFLGGFGSVAAEVAKRQEVRCPGLKVVLAEPGVPTISHDLRLKKRLSAIGRVDLLFVAYGMGQQEFFIERNRKKLNVGVMIGVGGAFDYLSGVKTRAPKFLQASGLEWLWRLALDPVRIWRMRVLPIFAFLIFLQFLKFSIFDKIFQKNNFRH